MADKIDKNRAQCASFSISDKKSLFCSGKILLPGQIMKGLKNLREKNMKFKE